MNPPAKLHVPMNDLKAQYETLRDEIAAAMSEVIDGCSFILGPQVERFEKAFAAYCGVAHCVGTSNGTDALKLALLALGIGPGDEVITTPHTFAATAEAVVEVGATPVFADVDPATMNLAAGQVARRMTPRTRAVIPVHLYGQMAAMDELCGLAAAHGLRVIEDAAQAHGARYRGKRAGAYGDLACFSFYPGKNLGAYGDAGGITGNDPAVMQRLRELRNHGQDPRAKFRYKELGYNHRMDGLQGAVLGVKLRHLEDWNARRRQIAARYAAGLAGVAPVQTPYVAEHAEHVYHLYVIRVPDREALAGALAAAGVQTAVHYPQPLHLTPAFAPYGGGPGSLPVSERICTEILSLPMYPEMTEAQIDQVIAAVKAHYARR